MHEHLLHRPTALQNTIYSEQIAAMFKSIIPVVTALEIDGKQIHNLNGMGMLGWLVYNVKRALGIEATTAEEVQHGKKQVLNTIQALYDYQEKVLVLKRWLDYER